MRFMEGENERRKMTPLPGNSIIGHDYHYSRPIESLLLDVIRSHVIKETRPLSSPPSSWYSS